MRPELLDRATTAWRGLQARERLLITLAAGFLLLALLYGFVWSPLQRELARLRADVPKKAEQVQWMRAQTGRVKQLRGSAPTQMNTGGLLSFIEQSATAYNVKSNIKRVDPDGPNGARVTLEGASFNSLVNWLANLHKQGSVRVENATIEAQPTPGTVNARLSLRAAGA